VAVEHLSATLQVWKIGGRPTVAEFLDQLVVDSKDEVKKQIKPNPRVDLMFIERAAFSAAEEPSEAFAAELQNKLTNVAQWLNKQPTTLFNTLRQAGFKTRVLFSGWIDCDQLDLDLPPVLLESCGRLGLQVSIITND